LLPPDWADQSVWIAGRTPVRRDVANLPADQRVLPSRHGQILDLVCLGHAGGDITREPGQAPALSSRSHKLGGDVLSCRCAHLDLSGLGRDPARKCVREVIRRFVNGRQGVCRSSRFGSLESCHGRGDEPSELCRLRLSA
jgi:hypothetical protein